MHAATWEDGWVAGWRRKRTCAAFSARGHFQILEPMFCSCAARHSGNIFFSFSLSNVRNPRTGCLVCISFLFRGVMEAEAPKAAGCCKRSSIHTEFGFNISGRLVAAVQIVRSCSWSAAGGGSEATERCLDRDGHYVVPL